MVHDVTNPPLAARFFLRYLAGYEIVSQNDKIKSMYGGFKRLPKLSKPNSIKGYSYRLSAMLAMIETAKKMQPSGLMLIEYEQSLLDSCRQLGFSEETIEQSRKYAWQ